MSADSSTRLLQLDGLLESKNRAIRLEAANAFGKFSIFDENVVNILKKHLTSQSWDARVAAGKALHSILQNMQNFEMAKKEKQEISEALEQLQILNVSNVLKSYKPLLADAENNDQIKSGNDTIINNRKQREIIDQHLEYNSLTGITSKKFLSDDELMYECNASTSENQELSANSQELLNVVKKEEENQINDEVDTIEIDQLERRRKFWRILRGFINQVVDQRWYARHGSAIAVCQISISSFHRLSNEIIDSCLYLFIHVLILDKFNDFISGRNATAPVREQCAQAVVHILRNTDEIRKDIILKIIVQMMNTNGEQNWNVRQSGLLVMKYYFAIATNDKNNQKTTFDQCFQLVIQSLHDTVDDVTGCAVKTLSSILANKSINKEEMGELVDKVMIHVWRLMKVEAPKEQLRAGLDALVIDLIEIVELWLNWKQDSSLSRDNLLIICSMLDVSFPLRCEKIINLIDLDLNRQNVGTLNAQDVFEVIKQFYRILLFTPPTDTLAFLEKTFLTFQKMFAIYSTILIENGEIVKKIGLWSGCLLYDHRNPMIDVYEHCVDGVSSISTSSCERMCSEEMRFLSEKEKDQVYLTRKILCAKFLATILQALYETDVEIGGQKISISVQLIFVPYFQSNSVMHNLGASIIVNEWAALYKPRQMLKEPPMTIVHLADNVLRGCNGMAKQYDEMSTSVNMLTKDCNEFIEYCSVRGFDKQRIGVTEAESIEEISRLAYNTAREMMKTEKQKESMDSRFSTLIRTIESVKMTIKTSAIRINSLLSSALFYFGNAPEKLTPQIRPLVETMQLEENDAIAAEIFRGSIPLLVMYSWPRTPRPYVKVLAKSIESFASCSYRIPKPKPIMESLKDEAQIIISFQRIIGNREGDEKEEENKKQDEPNALNEISAQSKNAELIMMILCQFNAFQLPEFYENFDLDANVDQLTLLTRLELHGSFWNRVGSRLTDKSTKKILELLGSPDAALRFAATKAIETFTKSQAGETMSKCYHALSQMAESIDDLPKRLGAVETFLRLSSIDGIYTNGLATLLCPMVFRLLTDRSEIVRDAAGEAFRRLVPMVTVENPNHQITNLNEELTKKRIENANFINVLGAPGNLPKVKVDEIRGGFDGNMLREYQIEGLTWLKFLRHYGLNGILADDMGLGKTLQTMCAIAMALDDKKNQVQKDQRCSLIVCPRTLVDHWCLEWKRYFPKREAAVKTVHRSSTAEICVVAYEDLKSNSTILSKVWNYVVLDEGHVMRNTKTQVWRCANSLICKSRLILSGTPVQNSPADLWALFTWLMPGYLGTEKQFRAQFLKKILKCRNVKASEADLKAGAAALNELHKLILPFVMRRMKCDVLKELPDKNVQDYECELSEDQKDVYRFIVDRCSSDADDLKNGMAISALHTLIALRKLVDHPILTMDTIQNLNAPADILNKAKNARSGKLEALGQLLVECGICANNEDDEADDLVTATTTSSDAHRALIFCQWKVSAKLVSEKLKNGEFGSKVPHLVLDGDVPVGERIQMVNRFNEDPTIDVLVLTTHIGGVGLNLTGADTVIFLDHDWNPMKDLQAIDRAHRLGQTRKVNVYRLITQGTIEQKVMSLAKFKLNTAQALISDDNTSLQSMHTCELMEMFTLDDDEKKKGKKEGGPSMKKMKKNKTSSGGIGEEINLAEMWDESQYDDFQVSSFLKGGN